MVWNSPCSDANYNFDDLSSRADARSVTQTKNFVSSRARSHSTILLLSATCPQMKCTVLLEQNQVVAVSMNWLWTETVSCADKSENSGLIEHDCGSAISRRVQFVQCMCNGTLNLFKQGPKSTPNHWHAIPLPLMCQPHFPTSAGQHRSEWSGLWYPVYPQLGHCLLLYTDKPHNPMINSGAIMTTSLCKPGLDTELRFEEVRAHASLPWQTTVALIDSSVLPEVLLICLTGSESLQKISRRRIYRIRPRDVSTGQK